MSCSSSSAFAARGRPHLDTRLGFNRLLSDNDTLLRGVSLSWDGGDPYGSLSKVVPSQASLDALATDYGLNTVHLYLEADSSGNTNPIGYNAADTDLLVQRTADAGLYLIITIGNNGENGTIHSIDWSTDFWEFYGPRYQDNTHVIYEAHNEPVAYTPAEIITCFSVPTLSTLIVYGLTWQTTPEHSMTRLPSKGSATVL